MASLNLVKDDRKCRFLSLPRELRDKIYRTALQTPRETSSIVGDSRMTETIVEATWRCTVYCYNFELRPQHLCEGLPLCNRQIHAEMQELLARKSNLDLCLELRYDYCITNRLQVCVWPTWTLYPGPVRRVCQLTIAIMRFFKTPCFDKLSDNPYDTVFRPLVRILNQLFHYGPCFRYSRPPLEHEIYVETQVISVPYHIGQVDQDYPDMLSPLHSNLSNLAASGILARRIARIVVLAGPLCDCQEREHILPANKT